MIATVDSSEKTLKRKTGHKLLQYVLVNKLRKMTVGEAASTVFLFTAVNLKPHKYELSC